MNQIVWETFMRKFSISFVESVVVSILIIHRQHLQNFLLDTHAFCTVPYLIYLKSDVPWQVALLIWFTHLGATQAELFALVFTLLG